MRTTERMIELDIAEQRLGLLTRLVAATTRVKSVWRAIRNRRAANRLADLDDFQLRDIGLSRSDVDQALQSSGFADDPSLHLSRSARNRSRRALRGLALD
ncbi:DUF1127 domain-containing protein [Rhizobium sp. KAs_5_22]|uniref:DUF1127 domain-containing protein n=1 Tax=Ciceribacter selenitireducens TaxID=448181 RepID=UPI00048B3113|nr:DUF1127 domain-containing protein [Ciceribacter selenitireducens]PPJ47679.1 DUF1127 domain-containing protein [Rhizobium sp. KAs_5_22]